MRSQVQGTELICVGASACVRTLGTPQTQLGPICVSRSAVFLVFVIAHVLSITRKLEFPPNMHVAS